MGNDKEAESMLDGTVVDPAVAAAVATKAAERDFLAIPANNLIDELCSSFVSAQARWQQADEVFADTVPTTPTGALLKLQALEDLHMAMDVGEDGLELRHIRSLMTFVRNWIARHGE
jgi:hypothetical protein